MRVDLHLHSCLSPCGDDQMRPDVLVGFSALGGVELVALTDHNSVRNCPAAAAAAANDACSAAARFISATYPRRVSRESG